VPPLALLVAGQRMTSTTVESVTGTLIPTPGAITLTTRVICRTVVNQTVPMYRMNPLPSRCTNQAPLLRQIMRFAIVGVFNTTVDLVVLNALILITSRGRSGVLYGIFKTVSFMAAVGNSYWMNSKWTFSQSLPRIASRQAVGFLSISLLGLATNVGIASWVASFSKLASIQGVMLLTVLWPSVAALAGSSCGLAFNFLGYKYLVFSRFRGTNPLHLAKEPAGVRDCLPVEEAELDVG